MKNLIKSSLNLIVNIQKNFRKMSEYLSVKHVRLVNSGSSANLVALAATNEK